MQFQSAEQAVTLATRAIFNRWTALSLVIEHHFNGATYLLDDMLLATVAMATNPSKRFNIDAYTDLFYDTFEKMQADILDGSPEQVAAHILQIRDAASVGNFAPAQDVITKAGISAQAVSDSVDSTRAEDDADDNCVDDEDFTPDENMIRRGPKTRYTPVVDEDGFQLVSKRRH